MTTPGLMALRRARPVVALALGCACLVSVLVGCTEDHVQPIPGPTVSGIISLPSPPPKAKLDSVRDLPVERLLRADGIWAKVYAGECDVLQNLAVNDRSGQPTVRIAVAEIVRGDDYACSGAAYGRVVRLPDNLAAARTIHDEVSGAELPVPQ